MFENELAEFLGVSMNSLAYWRRMGTAPPYFRIGARRIGYSHDGVQAWLAARRNKSIPPQAPVAPVARPNASNPGGGDTVGNSQLELVTA
jgi:predicted DNA-binding transcriptional regulator AlpA